MRKCTIRQGRETDLPAIIAIEGRCFPAAEAASPQALRERFAVFPENFLVAECEGQVVGFINGCTTDRPQLPDALYEDVSLHKPQGSYQTVFGLDVLPEWRNQGIAAQLMEGLIAAARERGREGMVLTCKDHLIHYYEKFGYVHQGPSASQHGGAKWNDMVLRF